MLTFEPTAHVYKLDGAPVPSVTALLSRLHSFANVSEAVLEAARERGSKAHMAAHYWDEGDLDEGALDEGTRGYLSAWQAFVVAKKPTFTGIEVMAAHPVHRYAGTVDRLAVINGEDWILDLKTAVASHWCWGPQLAAYAHLFGKPSARRGSVQLRADGTFKLVEWRDPSDWPLFVSLVTIFNISEKHRGSV